MKVQLNPKSDYRTTTPIYLSIRDVESVPKVTVSELGEFPVQEVKSGFYQSNFWAQKAGIYQIQVSTKNQLFQTKIKIESHEFLPFNYEFGAFFAMFLIASIGVILWFKKFQKTQS